MARGKKPDPTKRATRHPHASYFKVVCGEKHPAYLAGETYGCYGHRIGTHRPCMNDISEGTLQCPHCALGVPIMWRGYVPLWDRDWALRYALIGEDIFESVESIQRGQQVLLTRAKDPKSPLIIRPENTTLRALPDRAPWNADIEMLPICLTLWQDPVASKWFSGKRSEIDAEKANQVALKIMSGEPATIKDWVGVALGDKSEQVNRVKRNQAFVDAARNAEPAKNGKHKPKA